MEIDVQVQRIIIIEKIECIYSRTGLKVNTIYLSSIFPSRNKNAALISSIASSKRGSFRTPKTGTF